MFVSDTGLPSLSSVMSRLQGDISLVIIYVIVASLITSLMSPLRRDITVDREGTTVLRTDGHMVIFTKGRGF